MYARAPLPAGISLRGNKPARESACARISLRGNQPAQNRAPPPERGRRGTTRPHSSPGRARRQLATAMKRCREPVSPDGPAPKRSASDVRKLLFAEAAALEGDAAMPASNRPASFRATRDTLAALEWMASKPPHEAPQRFRKAPRRAPARQVREEREGAVQRVLRMAHQFRAAGLVDSWFRRSVMRTRTLHTWPAASTAPFSSGWWPT